MKYIIYCRKSTESEDRQLLSLDAQERELLDIANKNNLEIVKVFRESMSAKAPGRPIFDEMMEMIEKGKADAILCWKIDRITRNPVDGGKIQWLLQTNKIKCIQTFEKSYFPNDNVLLMSIEQAMASQYIRDLSVNVKRGLREKLLRGEWHNVAPLGYLNDQITKKIVVDPERTKYVIRMFELYRTGIYGVNEVANILFKEGFRSRNNKKVPKSKIHYMLSDPFYYGVMSAQGKFYKGNHEPIISKQLYDFVHEVIQRRLHPKQKTLMFPIRGLATCAECGCMYTGSRKKGHDYYHCTNGKGICTSHSRYLRENTLYDQIAHLLQKISLDEEEIELLYLAAKEDAQKETGYFDTALASLKQEQNTLLGPQNKLLDAFLDSSVSKEVYETKNLLIENTKVNLQKSIDEIEQKMKKVVATLEPTKKLFLDCNIWAKSFLQLPPEEKQNVVHEVLWNLSIKDRNILSYQMKSPYSTIANLPENADFRTKLRALESN